MRIVCFLPVPEPAGRRPLPVGVYMSVLYICVCHFLSVCGLYFKSYALHGVSVLICTLIFIVKKKNKTIQREEEYAFFFSLCT